MRLGVILSAGGSAFERIAEITSGSGVDFTVITSMPCEAEAAAKRVGARQVRIECANRAEFSAKAAEFADKAGIHAYLAYFDRLFSRDLFESIPTYNVHPSLLPAFAGMHAVERAHASRMRFIGCTLHRVDESVDGGPVLSQIARSADPDWPVSRWLRIAYLMKVYCGLVWVSGYLQHQTAEPLINASHGLPPEWVEAFAALQEREGEHVAGFAAGFATEGCRI